MAMTIEFVDGEAAADAVVVRADGSVLVDGKEASPQMAEVALRARLSGDDLDRALAALNNLTKRH